MCFSFWSDVDMLETGEKGFSVMYLGRGSANYYPWAKSSLLLMFIPKVYQNSCPFVYVLSIADFSIHSRVG